MLCSSRLRRMTAWIAPFLQRPTAVVFFLAGLLAASLYAPVAFAQKGATVTGVITHSTRGEPVPFATVSIEGTFGGTAADEDGTYRLAVPPGQLTLRIQALGFATALRTVEAEAGDTVQVNVALAPEEIQLGTVTVTADRSAAGATPSLYRLRPETIQNAPALGEPDVIRVMAYLPGVTQSNDMKAGLNIRGGASDQNQFLLDGIEVYNPNHLLGLLGAFNVWALSDVNVHVGDFPARYGGRLSSVISLETRSPPKDSAYAKGNLSLISAGGAYARRLGDTDVTLAARRTYADPVLAALGSDLRYNFYDANLNVTHPINDHYAVSLLGFAGRDALNSRLGEGSGPTLSTDWGNRMVGLRVKRTGGRWQHRLTGASMQNFSEAAYGEGAGFVKNVVRNWVGRYRGSLSLRTYQFHFGTAVRHLSAEQGWNGTSFPDDFNDLFYPDAPARFEGGNRGRLVHGYLSAGTYLSPSVHLQAGFRYSTLGDLGGGVLQPRGNVAWKVSDRWTLTASAGRYAQYVAEGAEGRELSVQQPTFLLDQPQTAWSVGTGAVWSPSPQYRLEVEVYGRHFERFSRLGTDVAAREKDTFTPGVARSVGNFPAFTPGTGRAFGVDLFLQKMRGWITGQLAYSFTQARVDFGSGPYPPDWSIPHSLNGLLGVGVGPWRVGVAGTLRSGAPYTPIRARFYGPTADARTDLDEQFLLGDANSERFPFYGRVDLSLRRTYTAKHFDWTLYLQVLNLFNSSNPQRLDLPRYYTVGIEQPGRDNPSGVTLSLPTVPSAGIEFTF